VSPPRSSVWLQVSSNFFIRFIVISWRRALLWVSSWTTPRFRSVIVWFVSIVLKRFKVGLFELTSSLWSCQINNVQKTLTRIWLAVKCLYFYLKYVMTPAWCFVHTVEFEYPFLLRHHYNIHEFLRVVNGHPYLSRAEYFTFITFYFKILIFWGWQKISDVFTINF